MSHDNKITTLQHAEEFALSVDGGGDPNLTVLLPTQAWDLEAALDDEGALSAEFDEPEIGPVSPADRQEMLDRYGDRYGDLLKIADLAAISDGTKHHPRSKPDNRLLVIDLTGASGDLAGWGDGEPF